MASYIVTLANGRISFKVGLEDLTAQSAMKPELVAAALTMKDTTFAHRMNQELGFKDDFDSAPLFIDNTSALQVAGTRTYSSRENHVALRYFFVQELVEAATITIHYVESKDQFADIGTKHLDRHVRRFTT